MRTRILFTCIVALLAVGPVLGVTSTLHAASTAIAAPAHSPSSPTSLPEALLYGLGAIGAIKVADTGTLAKKFVQRASGASKEYEEGVKQAGADWERGARDGAENYKMAVIEAANQGRFERGIANAGQAKYVERASKLGPQRFTTGVQAAEAAWARGVQPSLDAIKSLDLPAKRPRGQNAARANAVADRLHQERVSRLSGR